YAEAIPAIESLGDAPAALARRARLAHDLGRHDEADALFGRALEALTDTNPIPVPTLEVHRGLNLYDARRFEEALVGFRHAGARLPSLVAAKDHLAETLHVLGRDDEATHAYEVLLGVSDDPEFRGALAAIDRAHGRVAEADRLRSEATRAYEARLLAF